MASPQDETINQFISEIIDDKEDYDIPVLLKILKGRLLFMVKNKEMVDVMISSKGEFGLSLDFKRFLNTERGMKLNEKLFNQVFYRAQLTEMMPKFGRFAQRDCAHVPFELVKTRLTEGIEDEEKLLEGIEDRLKIGEIYRFIENYKRLDMIKGPVSRANTALGLAFACESFKPTIVSVSNKDYTFIDTEEVDGKIVCEKIVK